MENLAGKKEGVCFHTDPAYAGATFVCPEFGYFGKGLKMSDSFAFNCAKLLLITYDCRLVTLLWLVGKLLFLWLIF